MTDSTGLPPHLLRPLTASTRTDTVDDDDGSVTESWATTTILGRLGRGSADEADEQGRQGGVGAYKLFTNWGGLAAGDRVVDDTGDPWELVGPPVPVYAAWSIHHYEARLRRVDG